MNRELNNLSKMVKQERQLSRTVKRIARRV